MEEIKKEVKNEEIKETKTEINPQFTFKIDDEKTAKLIRALDNHINQINSTMGSFFKIPLPFLLKIFMLTWIE